MTKIILLGTVLLGLIVFSVYHTWYQNMPERLSDPVNWVVMAVLAILYFFVLRESR